MTPDVDERPEADAFVLDVNPDRNPTVSDQTIRTSLIDASALVHALGRVGGKIFTWTYPIDVPRSYYLVSTDLPYPMSEGREALLREYVASIGGSLRLEHRTEELCDGVVQQLHVEIRFNMEV